MSQTREKFATQVNAEILASIRAIAEQEGRRIQALVDEALADLIEKRKQSRPRPRVMATYLAGHDKYGELYNKLAKRPTTSPRRKFLPFTRTRSSAAAARGASATLACWKRRSIGRKPATTRT